jgi:hypothetical protein
MKHKQLVYQTCDMHIKNKLQLSFFCDVNCSLAAKQTMDYFMIKS